MTYPQVFKAQAGPAFTDEFQDMIREHMMARLPRIPVINPERRAYRTNDKFALRRAKLYPQVNEMKRTGASNAVIAKQMRLSPTTVARILEEGPNAREPLVAPATMHGRIDKWHDDRIAARKEWVSSAVNRGYNTQEIADALGISRSAVVRIVAKIREATA